jgi:hypothetical protein
LEGIISTRVDMHYLSGRRAECDGRLNGITFIGNVEGCAAGLAVHSIEVMPLQSACRAGKAHLLRLKQRTDETQE